MCFNNKIIKPSCELPIARFLATGNLQCIKTCRLKLGLIKKNKMKKILYTAVLSLFGLVVMAQNDVQYTHHLFNRLAYNPAYAGSQCAPVLNGTYRNQWAGLDKAPETGRLEFHTPFLGNRHGLGIGLTYDKAAIFRNTYVDLNYSYKIPISKKGTLALGIKGQFDNGRANFQDTNPSSRHFWRRR